MSNEILDKKDVSEPLIPNKETELDALPTASKKASAIPSKFKIVIVGDQSVGKTSIVTRFIYDSFDNTYQATIGIDFFSKNLAVDGQLFRLQLWDTAGLERFRALVPSYIRNSHVAIVVYDICSKDSFDNVEDWIDTVRAEAGPTVLLYLCGNKTDLEDRQVSYFEGQRKADSLGIGFVEMSALSGQNVRSFFVRLTSELKSVYQEQEKPSQEVQLAGEPADAQPIKRNCRC